MSLVGIAENICSEVVLSGEENTRQKGGDAGIWNFGGAVGVSSKRFWHFWLQGVAVATRDWDEDD